MEWVLWGAVLGLLIYIVLLQQRREKVDLSGVMEALSRSEQSLRSELGTNRTELNGQLFQLMEANRNSLEQLRKTLWEQLGALRSENGVQLEKIRETVDEKLKNTLEQRLGESFKLVSEQLLTVQKGLGEMRKLASDVGDLQRVLTNVKARGTWGEYQLENILSSILSPEQYVSDFAPKNGREVVEFAVKMPGRTPESAPVFLPVDAKFPKEDYERLVNASLAADPSAVSQAERALLSGIEKMAKDICDKYINPPLTTDFAVLFLPTEGLYAEVLRQPGFHDKLQHEYHVLPAGPTTLSALLNSLRVGFQTLAIEQRSHEVWRVLGAVKTEFGKFGEILDKIRKQLGAAANTLDETQIRTRAIERKLRTVAALSEHESAPLLTVSDDSPSGEENL